MQLGHKTEAVAKQQMVSMPTIYNWHKLWREQGIEGLANKPKTGRSSKATEAYCRKLAEMLEKEPAEYGYRFAIWTTDRLRAHLEKETGILLSEDRFRALLKKRGYRYRRPKYELSHLQDQKARKKAEKLLDEMKKEPPRQFPTPLCGRSKSGSGTSITCLLDEAGSAEDRSSLATRLQTTSPYPGSLLVEHRYDLLESHRLENSQTFLEFIEYLLVECYPTGRLVLVMDNVSYHKSASVLAALSLFEHRLLSLWLPPYCPELNLIERYWKHLKDLACANKLHNSIEEVVASVEFMLSQQNDPASNLRLTFSKFL